jgi:predicted DNA-binding transcriptional regulator AlpA
MSRIVRFPELGPVKGIPYGRGKLRRMIAAGTFPQPVRLDEREVHGKVGWLDDELDQWIESRAKLRAAAK